MGYDKGIWYRVIQGIQGMLVRDERGAAKAVGGVWHSPLYHSVTTKHDWARVLVEQRI